ncbi:MAG TPA: GatB/YqeY domain-containing protein [Polyangiaceae bacterium]
MLADEIKARMFAAMKAGRIVEKEILRVALGEIQTAASRTDKLAEDEVAAIVRKLVKSNRETLDLSTSDEQKATLEEEIDILEALLPKALGADDVALALETVKEGIRAAGSDGQATGIAMKTLKGLGITVDGKLVTEVVKRLRTA